MPSNIVAYEWPLDGTIHITYETGDNHIHEMVRREQGAWRDSDISSVTGAPELEAAVLAGRAHTADRLCQQYERQRPSVRTGPVPGSSLECRGHHEAAHWHRSRRWLGPGRL